MLVVEVASAYSIIIMIGSQPHYLTEEVSI